MAKKRKKGGVRWVGPAKLVAESQDSSGYGSGDASKSAGGAFASGGPGVMGAKSGRPKVKNGKKAPPPPKKKK